VRCVALVVPGSSSSAVSVSGPASRVTRGAVTRLVPLLREAGRGLAGLA
jgi:IclR family acetate operon transcriptional repressor